MKSFRILISFILVIIISCSSSKDTYESLSEEMLDVFEEITVIIDNATDELAVKESIAKLNELNDKMENLTSRMGEISELDDAAKEFLKSSDYEERFKNVLSNLFKSTISISDKSYGKDIMDALTNILNPNK